jgi:hypothetical protein
MAAAGDKQQLAPEHRQLLYWSIKGAPASTNVLNESTGFQLSHYSIGKGSRVATNSALDGCDGIGMVFSGLCSCCLGIGLQFTPLGLFNRDWRVAVVSGPGEKFAFGSERCGREIQLEGCLLFKGSGLDPYPFVMGIPAAGGIGWA